MLGKGESAALAKALSAEADFGVVIDSPDSVSAQADAGKKPLFTGRGDDWKGPLAAWLAPMLLLAFVRRAGWLGAGAAWLAHLAVGLVAWHGLVPLPGLWYVATVAATAR